MSDAKFLKSSERKKLVGNFDLPGGGKKSVLSRLSPRSSMSSVERPVPMPSTSTSPLTSTSTSTTTSTTTTNSTTTFTPTSTTTSTSPRSSLISPSLVFSSQSISSPQVGQVQKKKEAKELNQKQHPCRLSMPACYIIFSQIWVGAQSFYLMGQPTGVPSVMRSLRNHSYIILGLNVPP